MKGYPEEPTTLGQHLRKCRLDMKMTQEQARSQFGISFTAYNGWEADRIAPGIAKWPTVIQFLGYDPSPPPTSFCEALSTLRRALGLDKRKMAAKLGVDVKSILNWEAGRRRPLPTPRKKIAALAAECAGAGVLDLLG